MSDLKCPDCGGIIEERWKMCPFCGSELHKAGVEEQKTQIYSDTNHSREEELKREIEKLKKKNSVYLKPKRKKRGIIAIAVFILIILILSISVYLLSYMSQL